jgi:hypothetical protein
MRAQDAPYAYDDVTLEVASRAMDTEGHMGVYVNAGNAPQPAQGFCVGLLGSGELALIEPSGGACVCAAKSSV